MIRLHLHRKNSKIYRHLCVLSNFHWKFCHDIQIDLQIVEKKYHICLRLETAKSYEYFKNQICQFVCFNNHRLRIWKKNYTRSRCQWKWMKKNTYANVEWNASFFSIPKWFMKRNWNQIRCHQTKMSRSFEMFKKISLLFL